MSLKFQGNRIEKVFSPELNNMANVGVIAINDGCGVVPNTAMQITVNVGDIIFDGTIVSVSSQNLTINLNSTSNQRIDTILINSSGVASVLQGLPSSIPSPADYDPTLFTAVALIFVFPPTTTIALANIKDIRVFNKISTAGFVGDVIPSINDNFTVGSTDFKFNHGYFNNITTGDLFLQNGWRIVEYEDNDKNKMIDGVIILNKEGKEIFRITEDGLYFKSKKL